MLSQPERRQRSEQRPWSYHASPMLSFCCPGSNSGTCWMKACKSQIRESIHEIFSNFFSQQDGLCFCNIVAGLYKVIGISCNPSECLLFIDSSSRSVKAVLLHNGNDYPSLPIAHSVAVLGFCVWGSGIFVWGAKEGLSTGGAKLRLPKAGSLSRLGVWGSDAILNISSQNGVHF